MHASESVMLEGAKWKLVKSQVSMTHMYNYSG